MKSMPRKPPRMLQVPVHPEGFSARELYHGNFGLVPPLFLKTLGKMIPFKSACFFVNWMAQRTADFQQKIRLTYMSWLSNELSSVFFLLICLPFLPAVGSQPMQEFVVFGAYDPCKQIWRFGNSIVGYLLFADIIMKNNRSKENNEMNTNYCNAVDNDHNW